MTDRSKKLLVTGAGTGYLPIAPGTWASGAVAAIFFAVAIVSRDAVWASGTMAVLAVAAGAGCVALGPFMEAAYGKKDPRRCTIDEWAGQAVALIALPLGAGWQDLVIVTAVAFLAFRLLDIAKPPPIRRIEKLPFGWGVLLDDVVAGIYANLAAQLILRLGVGL